MNTPAVAVALASAGCFGVATSLQHRTAFRAPRGQPRLIGYLARRPWWLVGIAASAVGGTLHVVALRLGSLTLVQPLLVSGVVFALVIRALLDRRAPATSTVGWAGLAASGLAVFLLAADPTPGRPHPDPAAAALVLGAGATVAVTAQRLAARCSGRQAGALRGVATGVIFGLVAGALKATWNSLDAGAVLTSWPLYVLVPLVAWGMLLNQHAYHAAPLASSLPVLNVINPVVGIAFGAYVFGERPAAGPLPLALQLLGAVAMALGVLRLYAGEDARALAPLP